MRLALLFGAALALGIGAWSPARARGGQQPSQKQAGKEGAPAAQDSAAEGQALQAIQNELDPDRKLQMVSDFEKKYSTSPRLSFVYLVAADTYKNKGEIQKSIEYGEKSIKLNADYPLSLLMVASLLPEPQSLHEGTDQEREKKLVKAEDYANRAIKLIDQLPKEPSITDEQYQKNKGTLASWAHSSLGMVHLQRSTMGLTGPDTDELAKAENEYKTAVSLTGSPDPGDYFRLGEAYKSDGKTDEAIAAFSKAGELDQTGRLKPLVDQALDQLNKKKSAEKSAPTKP